MKTGIIASVIAIAGGATAIGGGVNQWESYGWVTRSAYEAEHLDTVSADQLDALIEGIGELGRKIDAQSDEWRCDELQEHIIDLLIQIESLPPGGDRIRLEEQLRQARARVTELACGRFTN